MTRQEQAALRNLIRVGTVSSVDTSDKTARVLFADKQDIDGKPFISEKLGVVYTQNEWLPTVGQHVLCLFLPNGNGDGFVIGRCM